MPNRSETGICIQTRLQDNRWELLLLSFLRPLAWGTADSGNADFAPALCFSGRGRNPLYLFYTQFEAKHAGKNKKVI